MTNDIKERALSDDYIKTEESKSQDQQKANIALQTDDDHEIKHDVNLITLQKVHAILINCINLTKKQKLEFAESERFFMKLHLKKLLDKLKD